MLGGSLELRSGITSTSVWYSVLRTIGEIIDEKFQLTGRVGAGGYGEVFEAVQIGLDRTVALKILRPEIHNYESRERLLREASILSRIRHRNIVTMYGYGCWQDSPYLAMEFVSGKTLANLIKVEPLRLQLAVELFVQIAEGLGCAHANSVVHRDLKPDNIILLASTGELVPSVKIIDFGLAKVNQINQGITVQQLTELGLAVGTVYYMSPEQCRGEEADQRSDIYSLGCMLFESLSGAPPFTGDSALCIMMQHTSSPHPPLTGGSMSRHPLASEVESIISKCLAKSPSERYSSVEPLLADLRSLQSAMRSMDNADSLNEAPLLKREPAVSRQSSGDKPHWKPVKLPVALPLQYKLGVAGFLTVIIPALLGFLFSDYMIADTGLMAFSSFCSLDSCLHQEKYETDLELWCLQCLKRSTNEQGSLRLVQGLWSHEVEKHEPNVPVLISTASTLVQEYLRVCRPVLAKEVCDKTAQALPTINVTNSSLETIETLADMAEAARLPQLAITYQQMLGDTYLKRGDSKSALASFTRLLKWIPRQKFVRRGYRAHLVCASIYCGNRDYENALMHVVQATGLLTHCERIQPAELKALTDLLETLSRAPTEQLNKPTQMSLYDEEMCLLDTVEPRVKNDFKESITRSRMLCLIGAHKAAEAVELCREESDRYWSSGKEKTLASLDRLQWTIVAACLALRNQGYSSEAQDILASECNASVPARKIAGIIETVMVDLKSNQNRQALQQISRAMSLLKGQQDEISRTQLKTMTELYTKSSQLI